MEENYIIVRDHTYEAMFKKNEESRFGEPFSMEVAVKEFQSYIRARGIPKGRSLKLIITVMDEKRGW